MFSGCKTQENIFKGKDKYSSKAPDEVGTLTYENNNDYNVLLLKNFKVKYASPDRQNTFYGTAKILRDSLMLLSLKAPMGIEIARVLLSKDSVKVINRNQNKAVFSDYNYLFNLLGFRLDFPVIESIFNGNFPEDYSFAGDNRKDSSNISEGLYSGIYYKEQNPEELKFEAWVIPDKFKLYYSRFYRKRNIKVVDIKYSDYEKIGGNYYPGEIDISHINQGDNETQIRMIFNNFEENSDKRINFTIPAKYEKIKLN